MAGDKLIRLYNRRLYNNSIDTLLKSDEKTSENYMKFALEDEKTLLDPKQLKRISANRQGTDTLRNISEEWEKAGDYERNLALKECFYDHAMNAAELLSVKGERTNENRILLKMKRSGCVANIASYKKYRRNAYTGEKPSTQSA